MASTTSRTSTNPSDYHNNLLKKLYEDSLENEEETDVVLVFGKFRTNAPTINVHSVILKSESSVLKDLMTSKVRNKNSIKEANGKTLISLQDDGPEAFKSFVKFLYGQKGLIKKDQLHKEAFPAFHIAKKYKALNMLKVLQEDCFPEIIQNFDNLNVPEVMSLAQTYEVNCVVDGVINYVKGKPRDVFLGFQAKYWANSTGETLLTQILSLDSYLVPECRHNWDRPPNWSDNERRLSNLACLWLRKMLVEKDFDKKTGKPPPSKRVRHDTDVPLAVRVLQKIRFREMDPSDLKTCLAEMHTFLTPHQIGTILLVCSGISQNEITDRDGMEGQFVVDTRMRHGLQEKVVGTANFSNSMWS